jgi:hypothetical protein
MLVSIRSFHARRFPVAVAAVLLGVLSFAELAVAGDQYAAVPGQVRQIKVLPDKAPDCSSLKSIVDRVTRGCKTNDEKCIAIYNFMLLTHYHFAYPDISCTLREINCYGWSLCGGLRSLMGNLWHEAGYRWRPTSWPGHNQGEVYYDGRWHFFDIFLKFYAWMPDPNAPGGRTVAGLDDMKHNPRELILDAFVMDQERRVPYPRNNQFKRYGKAVNWQAQPVLTCGDGLQDLPPAIRAHSKGDIVEPSAPSESATSGYTADVNLAPGFALTNTWDPLPGIFFWGNSDQAPHHTCGGFKDTRNDPGVGLVWEPYFDLRNRQYRSYGSGTLTFAPDFSNDACLKSLAAVENVKYVSGALVPAEAGKPASLTVDLASPYILCKATCTADGADSVAGVACAPGQPTDFSKEVRGKAAAQVKISFKQALKALKLEAVVQNNPGSLPYLSPGKNVVSVSVADAKALGDNRLAVTYAYRLGSRDRSFERMCDEGKEVAKGHDAKWSDTVIYVQKVYAAQDLPATFEIDCPTPKGRFPVYPRMVFLRREVLAPGQKPAELPAPPGTPAAGPGETLASLPNPFLVGALPPPAAGAELAKQSVLVPAKNLTFVSKDGEVAARHYVKWTKDNKEIWFLLLDFDGLRLPKEDDFAAANLVFFVEEAHKEASMRAAVRSLRAPFQPGKPYALTQLGDTVGTAVVKRGGGPDAPFKTPIRYEINVNKAVRAWIGGAKPHALALCIQPDRGVDDGWNVRFTPAQNKPLELEIATYVDAK